MALLLNLAIQSYFIFKNLKNQNLATSLTNITSSIKLLKSLLGRIAFSLHGSPVLMPVVEPVILYCTNLCVFFIPSALSVVPGREQLLNNCLNEWSMWQTGIWIQILRFSYHNDSSYVSVYVFLGNCFSALHLEIGPSGSSFLWQSRVTLLEKGCFNKCVRLWHHRCPVTCLEFT